MKIALADVPAPYLLERRVFASGASGAWHGFDAVLASAGIADGPGAGDLPQVLAYLCGLPAGKKKRLERALDAMKNGAAALAALKKPTGPDTKLLLCEGRVALARSNDQKPAKSPVGFSMFESAFADPDSTLRLPDSNGSYDVEAVLCAVIGGAAERVTSSQAARKVVGFTLMAQVTDRTMFDAEAVTRNNLYAKNLERLSPFGPCIWLAGANEIDPAVTVTLKVNGAERQRFAVADLAHTVPVAVRAWARCVLAPGDAVALGAAIAWPKPGNAVDSPIPIKPGDSLEVACAPIGTLRAKVA